MFRNRDDAARQLAQALAAWRGSNPLVLAIPRGALPMGRLIADELGGELDVVLVRKIGARYQPEFALAAIDENGELHWTPGIDPESADPHWLDHEKHAQLELLRGRRERYRAGRPAIDPAGRVVIVVDDGLATGSTMVAALHATRARKPERLICAVPVAAPSAVERVRPYADELVCLSTPVFFQAVSQFYREFPQVEDAEAERILSEARKEASGGA
ncbi:MAG TPA: phosphoribosyltransferase family protein [Burkholderiaceae bacterium]|jgi:predicted phosphoribosyltransferase|nr:phosphoribosyltransferase family protein [Burkholderiaceae bacterium]HRA77806.1 phosphoribosyltransferase family protein [Burkholderiaceae bacterium]